jgi:hypothetical protein
MLVVAIMGVGTVPPARSETNGTATFIGNLATGPMGYPCTPVGTTSTCPPGPGQTVGFALGTVPCVGEKEDVVKPGKGTALYGPLCGLAAAGQLTGWCGAATGFGNGTITFGGMGPAKSVNFTFAVLIAGPTMTLNGTSATKGRVTAILEVVADPTRGSCIDGSNTGWIVHGTLTLAGANT